MLHKRILKNIILLMKGKIKMQDIPPKILHYTLDYNKLARRIKRSRFSINDVIIRPISSKDKQRYASFINDYLKDKLTGRKDQIHIPLCNAERLYYIALYRDRIVGGVGMSKVASKDTELWKIAGLIILHELRGYGIGELLLKTIVTSI